MAVAAPSPKRRKGHAGKARGGTSSADASMVDDGQTPLAAKTCVLCYCTDVWPEGILCPTPAHQGLSAAGEEAFHFTCRDCVETAVKVSTARGPTEVTRAERAAERYFVRCQATGRDAQYPSCGCELPPQKVLAVLPPAAFDALQARNKDLVVHVRMLDEMKEYVARTNATPQSEAERIQAESDSVRRSFTHHNGRYVDEYGEAVKQCAACGFGPVVKRFKSCDLMTTHHAEIERDRHGRIAYRQDLRCEHCGFRNTDHWPQWPDWSGERVLGAQRPIRPADAVCAPTRG